MPKEGSKLKFVDGQNQFRVPLIMYADFESVLDPTNNVERDEIHDNTSYTEKKNKHVPSGYSVYSKFAYGEIEDPLNTYRGEDCVKNFCDYILLNSMRLYNMFPQKKMNKLTDE